LSKFQCHCPSGRHDVTVRGNTKSWDVAAFPVVLCQLVAEYANAKFVMNGVRELFEIEVTEEDKVEFKTLFNDSCGQAA
jgi:hypothetical protein